MSNYTTSRITTNYQTNPQTTNLLAQINMLRRQNANLQTNLQNSINSNNHNISNLTRQLKDAEAKNGQLQRSLNQAVENAAKQAQATAQAIADERAHTDAVASGLHREISDLRTEYDTRFSTLETNLTNQINDVKNSVNTLANAYAATIKDNKHRHEAAVTYLETAEILYNEANNYNRTHIGLSDEDFRHVSTLLANARNDIDQGEYNDVVAIASGNDCVALMHLDGTITSFGIVQKTAEKSLKISLTGMYSQSLTSD